MTKSLNNWEIAVLALYTRGGATRHVHTEDIALACFELSPESFSWVNYPQYPDKDIVRVALTDARKARIGTLVTGRSGRGTKAVPHSDSGPSTDGWMLTQAGVAWVLKNEARLNTALGGGVIKSHRQQVLQKVAKVRAHLLFVRFQSDNAAFSPSLGELGDLLRCRVDAERPVWKKRLALLRNEALLSQQPDLIQFVDACASQIDQLTEDR
jgi:hypothetical protein